jgi:NAD(P)-dependent dehydrogenase (short-subunit alcohol dehydrogenase family)
VAAAEARYGGVDICVTNSGDPPSKSFSDTAPEEWRAVVEHFLMSTILFAREALHRMQKKKWGRLNTIILSAVSRSLL